MAGWVDHATQGEYASRADAHLLAAILRAKVCHRRPDPGDIIEPARQAGRRKPLLLTDRAMNLLDGRFLLTSALLVLALLLGAAIIGFVRRWMEIQRRGETQANDQLSQYRAMHLRGELSDEEFQRLRDVLAGQLRREAGLERTVPDKLPGEKSAPENVQSEKPAPPPDDRITS